MNTGTLVVYRPVTVGVVCCQRLTLLLEHYMYKKVISKLHYSPVKLHWSVFGLSKKVFHGQMLRAFFDVRNGLTVLTFVNIRKSTLPIKRHPYIFRLVLVDLPTFFRSHFELRLRYLLKEKGSILYSINCFNNLNRLSFQIFI